MAPRKDNVANACQSFSLCDSCQGLLKTSGDFTIQHRLIEKNANTCSGCSLLLRGLRACFPSYAGTRNPQIEKSQSGITIKFYERTNLFTGLEGIRNPWNLRPSGLPSTKSTSTMELMLEWVRACAHHKNCTDKSDKPLPARILDIGLPASEKVVLLEPVNQKGRYLCLSYCWGKYEFINTSKENLEDHKKGIPRKMLPRAFQDAIEVAHWLGVRYIWIDALCIVQNDYLDWERESAKMADIYRNSFLTIAATSVASPRTSFFSASSRFEIDSVCVRLIHHFHNSPTSYHSNIFPLLTRAWTYQERILPPRVLHFGREEIVWECFDRRLCECGQGKTYFRDEVSKSNFFDTLIQPISHSHWSPGKTWRQMVFQYSPLALTVPSDKLPAISGLAEQMRRSTNQEYLAGVWKTSLPLDLLWYRDFSATETLQQPILGPNDLAWRAPSWSWASVDGQICYSQPLYMRGYPIIKPTVFCDVLNASATTTGQPATGQITTGFIELKCFILPVTYRDGILSCGESKLKFYADNRINLEQTALFIVRMAQFAGYNHQLVIGAIDLSQKRFIRAGLTESTKLVDL